MHQRGESTDQKSRCPHITLRFEEAPLIRLSVGTLQQVVKRDLSIAFVPQQLTSYGGLELLRRYVRRIELPRRLQAAPSEGPQLLPAARPRRADRPHPADQESPRQRARLQAVRRVPPRAHRRGPPPPGAARPARIPHGCRVFPA